MTKTLIPVDASEACRRAVNWAISHIRSGSRLELELLNIQPEIVSGHARAFLSRSDIDTYTKDEAEKVLQPYRDLLGQLGISFRDSYATGHAPDAIAKYAKENGAEQIVMGTRGLGSIRGMLLGSVATGVLHLVDVPVTLVK